MLMLMWYPVALLSKCISPFPLPTAHTPQPRPILLHPSLHHHPSVRDGADVALRKVSPDGVGPPTALFSLQPPLISLSPCVRTVALTIETLTFIWSGECLSVTDCTALVIIKPGTIQAPGEKKRGKQTLATKNSYRRGIRLLNSFEPSKMSACSFSFSYSC